MPVKRYSCVVSKVIVIGHRNVITVSCKVHSIGASCFSMNGCKVIKVKHNDQNYHAAFQYDRLHQW